MKYRTALVTGASSGIGAALCTRMARDGVEVALAARRVDALETVAREIRDAGGKARVYELDVTDATAVRDVLSGADDDMEGLDLVVANAGIEKRRWSGKLRWEQDVAPVVAVNVVGFLATVTALAPRMVERSRGHLVGISSLAGYRGVPRNAVYSGSKAFVSTFLEGMRIDLRKTGVTVTDVRPGFVKTPLTAEAKITLPLLWELDHATETIWRGIQARRAVIEFPWPAVAALRSFGLLPRSSYDFVIKRLLG